MDRIDVMRETAATTGTSADAEGESAEDRGVPDEARYPDEAGRDADGRDDGSVGVPHGTSHGISLDVTRDVTRDDGDPTHRTYPVSYTRPEGMPPPPDHLDTSEAGTVAAAGPWTGTGTGTGTDGGRAYGMDPTAAIGSARVHEAVRATRAAAGPRGPRRARLSLKRLDPWSVMKFSFTVSLVLFIVMLVAASVLYLALDTMGVFATVNSTLADLIESGGGEGGGFRITAQNVIGTAAALGGINVVLFTALATLGAFIYNVCADLVGGVEVTLAERD
jgi:hypothetical protein